MTSIQRLTLAALIWGVSCTSENSDTNEGTGAGDDTSSDETDSVSDSVSNPPDTDTASGKDSADSASEPSDTDRDTVDTGQPSDTGNVDTGSGSDSDPIDTTSSTDDVGSDGVSDSASDSAVSSETEDTGERDDSDDTDTQVDTEPGDFLNIPCSEADTPVGRHGKLAVQDGVLQNECGHPVQLIGVSSMWLNWETKPYAENLDALKWMVDNWHITLIRAAMGTDDTYYDDPPNPVGYLVDKEEALAQVTAIVDNAVSLGIYVIIDWHGHTAYDYTDEAVDFFDQMSEVYGELPNVIYEPFNEPRKVDWQTQIKPYHEQTVAAIRANDPDNIILLGTPWYDQHLDEALADPVDGTNLMYTVHFYACSHQEEERAIMIQAADAGLPIFASEWGATPSDGGVAEKIVCEGEADKWLDALNRRGISWAAWKLDACTDTSCILEKGAPVDGNWDDALQGHGPYVVQKILER